LSNAKNDLKNAKQRLVRSVYHGLSNTTYVDAQASPRAAWNNISLANGASLELRALPPGHQSRNKPKHIRQITDPITMKLSMKIRNDM
jgi:hypothetical protein